MPAVSRLVTVVDIDMTTFPAEVKDAPIVNGPAPAGVVPTLAPTGTAPYVEDPREISLSALHVAVLEDGRRVTLLDDRGWSVHGPADIWHQTSIKEIEAGARMVVGPDEPYGSRSQVDMETHHWAHLAGILGQQGVLVEPQALGRLPHDVETTERLRSRLSAT